jgi:hypothetical protein
MQQNDKAFLAAIGARRKQYMRGHWTGLAPMLPVDAANHRQTLLPDMPESFLAPVSALPGQHRSFLRCFLKDVFKPIDAEALSHDLGRSALTRPFANAASGRFDLGSFYGSHGLEGDLARQFAFCMRDPVNRAFLRTGQSGEILTLGDLIFQDYPILNEAFFQTLPTHLKPRYFKDGALDRDQPVVLDPRHLSPPEDVGLLRKLTDQHNALAQQMSRAPMTIAQQDHLFLDVSRRVAAQSRAWLRDHLLVDLCDPNILAWSEANATPIYRDLAATHDGHTLPIEGFLLLKLLSRANSSRTEAAENWGEIGRMAMRVSLQSVDQFRSELGQKYGLELEDPSQEGHSDEKDTSFIGFVSREVSHAGTRLPLGKLCSLVLSETLLPALENTLQNMSDTRIGPPQT